MQKKRRKKGKNEQHTSLFDFLDVFLPVNKRQQVCGWMSWRMMHTIICRIPFVAAEVKVLCLD